MTTDDIDPEQPGDPPVVVTFREVERVLTNTEAVKAVVQSAKEAPGNLGQKIAQATAAAAMGSVLNELRRSEADAGAQVLNSPHSGLATRIQSMIAEKALRFDPLTSGGLEAKFDTGDWIGWASVAWEKIKHLDPHPMVRPTSTAPDMIADTARIGLLGDWGTGLYGALPIVDSIRNDTDPFDVLVHLGDVYYAGTVKEIRDRFLKLWPMDKAKFNRAINSNHEMYAGGEGYFLNTLKSFVQSGSYFAFQNKYWALIGLDLAYVDHDIDPTQIAWLASVMAQLGNRKVILLSHHQLFSHFESQADKLIMRDEFVRILKDPRIVAWYWGHEHRCTIFEQPHPVYGLYGRCIGHGGMPQSRDRTRDLPRAGEPLYKEGLWVRSRGVAQGGQALPDCVVLEGPNPYIKGEEDRFTPHGFAVLRLEDASLIEEVRDPMGKVIYEHRLVA